MDPISGQTRSVLLSFAVRTSRGNRWMHADSDDVQERLPEFRPVMSAAFDGLYALGRRALRQVSDPLPAHHQQS